MKSYLEVNEYLNQQIMQLSSNQILLFVPYIFQKAAMLIPHDYAKYKSGAYDNEIVDSLVNIFRSYDWQASYFQSCIDDLNDLKNFYGYDYTDSIDRLFLLLLELSQYFIQFEDLCQQNHTQEIDFQILAKHILGNYLQFLDFCQYDKLGKHTNHEYWIDYPLIQKETNQLIHWFQNILT